MKRCFVQRSRRALYLAPLLSSFPIPYNAFPTHGRTAYLTYPTAKRNSHVRRTLTAGPFGPIPGTLRTVPPEGRPRRASGDSSRDNDNPTSRGKNCVEDGLLAKEESARMHRMGQMKRRLQRNVYREDRISILELKQKRAESGEEEDRMTYAETAELEGLLKARGSYEEQYDPLTFTEEHLEFKAMHNDAFIALSRYCEKERYRIRREEMDTVEDGKIEPVNLFFLDGPDGGTASAVIDGGHFEARQCFVANRHASSCESLRMSGGGRLLEENVVHATAAEALTVAAPLSLYDDGAEERSDGRNDVNVALLEGKVGAFSHIDFAAYYFDGCGGFVPHILGMLSAALLRDDLGACIGNSVVSKKPIVVGYSLLGGNRDVVEKELVVSQALTIIARRRGLRMVHALDDPIRYGISPDVKKIGGGGGSGTFTTWLILEPID